MSLRTGSRFSKPATAPSRRKRLHEDDASERPDNFPGDEQDFKEFADASGLSADQRADKEVTEAVHRSLGLHEASSKKLRESIEGGDSDAAKDALATCYSHLESIAQHIGA
jgi:hypothetical protein